jgi:hypothetical protein
MVNILLALSDVSHVCEETIYDSSAESDHDLNQEKSPSGVTKGHLLGTKKALFS